MLFAWKIRVVLTVDRQSQINLQIAVQGEHFACYDREETVIHRTKKMVHEVSNEKMCLRACIRRLEKKTAVGATSIPNSHYILLLLPLFSFLHGDSSMIHSGSQLYIRGRAKNASWSLQSVIHRIPLSCDVRYAQGVDPWGRADSESLIREGVSKHDYVP